MELSEIWVEVAEREVRVEDVPGVVYPIIQKYNLGTGAVKLFESVNPSIAPGMAAPVPGLLEFAEGQFTPEDEEEFNKMRLWAANAKAENDPVIREWLKESPQWPEF